MSEGGIQVGVARARSGAIAGARRAPAATAVDEAAVRAALTEVMDPELPMLSVVDLGIIHRVDVAPAADGPIRVEILPTFVGCPALELIKASIAERLGAFGRPVEVTATFEVPWTSERISPAGRAALLAAGIAPPGAGACRQRPDAHRPRAARPVPALRFAPNDRREPVRADPVPDDPLLRRLPPAVRIDQVGLMASRAAASSGERLPAIVGIVGAGTMGAGIGQVALEAGCEVVFYDVDEAAIERGARADPRRADAAGGETRPRRGPRPTTGWRLGSTAIRHVPTVDGLADDADLVIESALEDLALKRTVFRTLDEVADPSVILATNTSALSVAEIAEATRRPDRVIGLHFFNPAPIMALVEVVAPPLADPAVVARAVAIVTAWGKTPVVCADRPGFIVNRVNRPFTIEALRILETGAAERDRDRRGAARRRLPDGSVRADGPDRDRRHARRRDGDLGGPRPSGPAPALADPGSAGRGRRPRAQDRPGLLPIRGRAAPRRGRATGRQPPRTSASLQRRSATGSSTRSPTEARLAADEGVATPDVIDLALRLGAGHPHGPSSLDSAPS